MSELGETFRSWIAEQQPAGCSVSVLDDDHLLIKREGVTGQVNFYAFDDAPEVVELCVTEDASGENRFFLHFELEDLERAEQLFGEMMSALQGGHDGGQRRILLCCTVGMTTSLFAQRLGEAADALSIDYVFEAKGLDEARRQGGNYDAVMLAPQVGYRRREAIDAFPHAVVFEIPPRVFASYDTQSAIRMLADLLGDNLPSASDLSDLRTLRSLSDLVDMHQRVLILSVICRQNVSTIAWRIYSDMELEQTGSVHKLTIGLQDLLDVTSTLRMGGVDLDSLDAVGVAVPGAVDFGTVTYGESGLLGCNIEQALAERLGVCVFVDNSANAGAVGCYVSQDCYDSVTLHTQEVGTLVGEQGTVCNGQLLRGRRGMAGELGALNMRLLAPYAALDKINTSDPEAVRAYCKQMVAWSSQSMLPVLTILLLANIATAAPDAIYLNYDLVDDVDELRAELVKTLPEELMPDIIRIDNYKEKVFLGELALVLQRLAAKAS